MLFLTVMTYIMGSFTVPAVILEHRRRAPCYSEATALLAQNKLNYSTTRNGTAGLRPKYRLQKRQLLSVTICGSEFGTQCCAFVRQDGS